MQQSLDRRQPSARVRPQLREIPLPRRRRAAGIGKNSRQWTSRDDRSSPAASGVTAPRDLPPQARDERRTGDPFRGGELLLGVGKALDPTTGQDVQVHIAATTGIEVLQENSPDRLMAAVVSGDVDPAAAPAAEPLAGVGQPEGAPALVRKGQEGQPVEPREPEVLGGDARQPVGRGVDQVQNLVGPAAVSAGTARGGTEPVNHPTVDVAGDQLRDAQPADGHMAEEGQLAVGVLAAGDLLSGDRPVVSDQAWSWMEPLLPSSTGGRGGRWRDHRQVVEAICWKYRTGSTWRELPARFGPWQTAYERLTRWSADGTWARLLARAQAAPDASGELDWLAAVDSTVLRVHKRGASARRVGSKAATALPDDPQHGEAA
jgi:putative transposase